MQELTWWMLSLPSRLARAGLGEFVRLGKSRLTPPGFAEFSRRHFSNAGGTPDFSEELIGREGINRAIIGWMSAATGWEEFSPLTSVHSMFGMFAHAPELFGYVLPGIKSRAAWKETRNKLQTYSLFTNADCAVRLYQHRREDVTALVRRLTSMQPYSGLWSTEGLGYYHASAELLANRRPRNLLAGFAGELGQRYLIPLHTGMGLAFALHQLQPPLHTNPSALIRQRLEEFLDLCQANAREGYLDAAVEQLGLIARLLRPRLIPMLERELTDIDSNHVRTFWHGIGRALYFTPTNVLPCGSVVWPGLKKAQSEPPHEIGRVNAIAGFAWAVTLVNIRHPEVLEMLLLRHADELGESKAFANGVSSAMAVWQDWAPGSPYLDNLSRYQPRQLKPAALRQWELAVRSRCSGALAGQDHVLKCRQRRGDLFRYSQPNQ